VILRVLNISRLGILRWRQRRGRPLPLWATTMLWILDRAAAAIA
jgi:hypothetical protein